MYIFSSLDFKMIIFPSCWRGNFVVSLTYSAVCFSIYFCMFEFWPRDRYSVIIFFISSFYRFERWVKTVIDQKYKCCIFYSVYTWIKETVCHFQRIHLSKNIKRLCKLNAWNNVFHFYTRYMYISSFI